ncbi:hypothetical protein BJV78DRAFT_1281270 [Lactifluus subvellereus]|nr:hypothetical protein BJV78DRAFT_1281270 [Lactifluus subvellereus]
MFADRRASFKQPPRHVLDTTLSQESRRNKALEEQKRRRARRVESERHIDLFADLNLGQSDDEGRKGDDPDIVREGVAQLAALLPRSEPVVAPVSGQESHAESNIAEVPQTPAPSKRKGSPKKPAKASVKKASSWANKSLAPVPVGKRCLAISHQGGGTIGAVPNTTIRSRVLGKPIIPRFPSPLPSDTVLDCILDQNWRENGILHVLDVIKWKGQDIADCESSFRYAPVRIATLAPPDNIRAPDRSPIFDTGHNSGIGYRFPYPATFLRIPYYTNTTFSDFLSTIIPQARSSYHAQFTGPVARAAQAEIKPDGLLLYVAQAIYEPGTNPLSSWVPLVAPATDEVKCIEQSSPLDVFERLVKKRVTQNVRSSIEEVDMLP